MNNYEEQIYSIIHEALYSICESKPANPIESLSQKMFELVNADSSQLTTKKKEENILTHHSSSKDNSMEFNKIYKIIKKIGVGNYGKVYTISPINSSSSDNQIKAVKIIKKNIKQLSESNSEMLKKLDHPHIIKIHDIQEDVDNIFIIMEYCKHGDLLTFIQNNKISEQQAKIIIKQVLLALSYLHKNKIIHRDIKPENILIAHLGDKINNIYPDIHIKLIDFGSAKYFDKQKHSESFKSPYYTAPEVLTGNYNEKCDIWSTGILFYMLINSKPPFNGSSHEIIYNLVNEELKFKGNESVEVKEFIKLLLAKSPNDRFSASEYLNHPLLNSLEPNEELTIKAIETLTNIKDFWNGNTLRKQILTYISEHKLYLEDNYECAKIFQELDKNNDGQLDINEIFTYFGQYFVGTEQNEMEQITKLVENIDVNKNGKIDYSEFMMVLNTFHRNNEIKTLSDIFDRFDADCSGYIEIHELKELLKDAVIDKSFEELLSEFDDNGDNKLSKEEFISLVTKFY